MSLFLTASAVTVSLCGCYITRSYTVISCYTSIQRHPLRRAGTSIVQTPLRLASITASAYILAVATVARFFFEASRLFGSRFGISQLAEFHHLALVQLQDGKAPSVATTTLVSLNLACRLLVAICLPINSSTYPSTISHPLRLCNHAFNDMSGFISIR